MTSRQPFWSAAPVLAALALLAGCGSATRSAAHSEQVTDRAWKDMNMNLFFLGFDAVPCPPLPGWEGEGGTCHTTNADATVALRRLGSLNYALGHLWVEGEPQQSGDTVRGRAVAWSRARGIFDPSQVAFEIDYLGLTLTPQLPSPEDASQVLQQRGLVSVIRVNEPTHHRFPLRRVLQDQALLTPAIQRQHRRELYHSLSALHWSSLGDLGLTEVDCAHLPPVQDSLACYVFPPASPAPGDLNAALTAWAADGRRYTTQWDRQQQSPPPPPLRLWQGGGFAGMAQTLPLRMFSGGPLDREQPDTERNYAVQVLLRTGPEGGAVPAEFREAATWLAGQGFPGYLALR